jgi:hypothetical protein
MMTGNAVFLEEILDNELPALRVVQGPIALKKSPYLLLAEMGLGNLLLR